MDRFCKSTIVSVTALLILSFGSVSTVAAQQLPASADVASAQQNPGTPTLSATRIIRLIDEQPQAGIELKRLMAERLRAQGIAIEEDGITDEALFRQLAQDMQFRGASTLFLRARGYISDSDLDQAQMLGGRNANNPVGDLGDLRDAGEADSVSLSPNAGLTSSGVALSPGEIYGNADAVGLASLANLPDVNQNQVPSTSLPAGSSSNRSRVNPNSTVAVARPRDEEESQGPRVLREPAPYNLEAMRDLYTQLPKQTQKLKRFGSDVFVTRTLSPQTSLSPMTSAQSSRLAGAQQQSTQLASLQALVGQGQSASLDAPPGPDYVLGRGDVLSISMWGGLSQTISRTVDAAGTIVLPESGPLTVAGLKLEQARALIEHALSSQFRNAHIAVTLSRIRSVRIYVVGDVQRPGAYDISAQSTPLNALYVAGGPTAVGSLRTLRHMRGNEIVRDVDLYDFLLHGVRTSTDTLEDGDTILVPPVGPQIAISGNVKRPAIYELKKGQDVKLSEVLEDAGGVEVSASLGHISVERVTANERRETVRVGENVNDLPSLRKALEGFGVHDGDRVFVASIVSYSERAVYLEGHVARPGRQPYRDNMLLTDVVRSYQDLLPEPADRGQIIRLTPPDLHPQTIEFNVADVLSGNDPLKLQPYDTIRILGRYVADAPMVTVRGEVLKPGVYPMSSGMTVSQLVKAAGGFTRGALRTDADLASYQIQNGESIASHRETISLSEAMRQGGGTADTSLKPGDVLTVHQITGWADIGSSVQVSGEVSHPGSYGIEPGEKLSDILRRAGGFRDTAYPIGAILLRQQVRDLEDKTRKDLIHQIETTPVAAKLGTNLSGQDETSTLQLLQHQEQEILQQLRNETSDGRMVIRIDPDLQKWQNTSADIEVRSGDELVIPKRPGFVLVSGQVYNASALTFVPNKTAGWYLKRAGGTTELANSGAIIIVRADGETIGRSSVGHFGSVLSVKLNAGDVIVVPQKIVGGSMFWRNVLTTAQILSAAALPIAIAGV